jgi:dipeptidyl aminopeptidase/acylaminoacyl peptidase
MRPRSTVLASALVVTAIAGLMAQSPRPMTIVDLINVPRLSTPQLSPDGRQILFVRSGADWKANKRVSHIWRVNADGSGLVQLTNGPEGESSPRWSPDGQAVAFVARRAGDEVAQLYLLSNLGGEALALTKHSTAVSNPAWAPDGTSIFFLAEDPKPDEEKARAKAQDDVYAYDEDFQQRHLWKVEVATRATTRLTTGDFSVLGFDVSRDGARLVMHRSPTPLYGDNERGEVWVVAADGREPRRLTTNTVTESRARLSPDGREVLFLSDSNARFETYFNDKIFVVPVAGGPARLVTTDLPYEVEEAEWAADGKSLYFVANTGVRSQLFRMAATGGPATPLTKGDHAVVGWSYAPRGGRHVFTLDQPDNPGEVWLLGAAGAPTRVTHIFEGLSAQFKLPRQERVEWKGADGATVEGLLYYPLDYQRGQRFPLVVQTHGGPAASDKFGFGGWADYVQVLAAKGYAVLQPNYRGSTGYGDAFLRDMIGQYFRNAHLDVMAGVDHLVTMGLADPDRLVKMGWSAGGHMTNKIITFTDRFKAASSGAGAANWVSMYAQSDVRTYRTPWFGGTPWQKDAPIAAYWDNSPIKDVSRVRTPTIFIVGERDVRVPLPQAVEMFRALKANGVPTRLYVAPREPHGFQELRHQLFKVNVELEWFEKHAMGRPYTWERAPGDEEKTPAPTAGR